MKEKYYFRRLVNTFPEYIEYLKDEKYYENMWSIPFENLAIKIAELYSKKKLSDKDLESVISRWATLTNEAYYYHSAYKPKLDEFDPSYGYWLALEVLSFYPEIASML
jgi:hypothetical protein